MHQIARSPQQLGAIIRRTRRKRGWTQSQLADLAGLRQELISKIETGHESTKLSSIHALFAALSLDLVVEERNTGRTLDIGDIF
jgi:HTH-type transcriptional regulator / antitoxin HipB